MFLFRNFPWGLPRLDFVIIIPMFRILVFIVLFFVSQITAKVPWESSAYILENFHWEEKQDTVRIKLHFEQGSPDVWSLKKIQNDSSGCEIWRYSFPGVLGSSRLDLVNDEKMLAEGIRLFVSRDSINGWPIVLLSLRLKPHSPQQVLRNDDVWQLNLRSNDLCSSEKRESQVSFGWAILSFTAVFAAFLGYVFYPK